LALEWLGTYWSHLPLSAELEPRERGHGDLLPMLAAELLIGRPTAEWFHPRPQPLAPLLHTTVLLAAAHANSKHNPQIGLALMQAYLCLGSSKAAFKLYQDAEIKQVQHESLSYLLLPAMVQLGAVGPTDHLLALVASFHKDGLRDVPESTMLAFDHDNCDQALDFVHFKRTLARSWWRAMLDIVALLSRLHKVCADATELPRLLSSCPSIELDLTTSTLEALPDTLDLDAFESHVPPPAIRGVRKLRSGWLPRRALLLRLARICTVDGADLHALTRTAALLADECSVSHGVADAVVDDPSVYEDVCDADDVELCGGSEDAGGVAGDEGWAALQTMARCAMLFAQQRQRQRQQQQQSSSDGVPSSDATAEAAEAMASVTLEPPEALPAELGKLASRVGIRCAKLATRCARTGGATPSGLASLAQLSQLELPMLVVFRQSWASMLPRKKKGGKGDAETEAAEIAQARAALREADAAIALSLSQLLDSLTLPSHASAAVAALEADGPLWGSSSEEAAADATAAEGLAAAREVVLKAVGKDYAEARAGILTRLKAAATSLKQVARGN